MPNLREACPGCHQTVDLVGGIMGPEYGNHLLDAPLESDVTITDGASTALKFEGDTTNWATGASWQGGVVPTDSDDVTLQAIDEPST